ncbi:MAG TPA: hypothetical protein VJS15_01490 [Allosphingosinicella sp.]|nr:hypothetical protein [Allosphingosinicella sp.]
MWRAFKISAIVIALGGLALLGLLQWLEERKGAAMRAESRERLATQMRQAAAEAQSCIDEIAALDPAAEAARDVARGDATPMAVSFQAHDPPDISTGYPGVESCRYAGAERQDPEKRMRHTGFRFSHVSAPNQHRCELAALGYVAAYNAEMLRRAPAAIAAFCRASTDPDEEPVRFRP